MQIAVRWVVVAALLLWTSVTWSQVQKCTGPDGRVVYSDRACPAGSAQTGVKLAPQGLPPVPDKVVFSGTPAVDYIKASALLENIRTLGRDCEWALKVDRRDLQSCSRFLAKLGPGGEYEQVTNKVSELNKSTADAGASVDELNRMLRIMPDIIRYKEFAIASLGGK
jgi:hypothetical protein